MGVVIVGLVGALLLGLGYLVGARRRLDLLAGYRAERVRDKDALARWAGRGLALLGAWTLAAAIGIGIRPRSEAFIMPAWAAGLLLGTLIVALGSRRHAS